jgi:PAS domain S-box-containing protein
MVAKTKIKRFEILIPYCLGLREPSKNKKNLAKAKDLFPTVTAQETLELVDIVILTVQDMEQVKPIVTRMLHSFTKGLTATSRPFKRGIPFVEKMLEANDQINTFLDSMMPTIAQINKNKDVAKGKEEIRKVLLELEILQRHYIVKENHLFPIVETYIQESRCTQLMWSIHDDIRRNIKILKIELENDKSIEELNAIIGDLFFDMRSMIFREEQVLFPAVLHRLPEEVIKGFDKEQFDEKQADPSSAKVDKDLKIDLITGNPTASQLVQIFNTLPVDITLVDNEDRVVYFNTPATRLFPRSKSVVGRTVQNCHPPESVDIVEKILKAFREKRESEASFRIMMKDRYILISYYPIYNSDGSYEGTMEVSQDITDLKTLEGERRLLSWDK